MQIILCVQCNRPAEYIYRGLSLCDGCFGQAVKQEELAIKTARDKMHEEQMKK